MSAKARYSDNVRRISVHSAYRDSSGKSQTRTTREQTRYPELPANSDDDGHVKVAVRCRPMSDKEISAGHETIVDFESDKRIVVHDVSEKPGDQLGTKSGERRNVSHVYDFDCVFDCHSTQEQVYDQVCRPIVQGALEGYNGTIFAYGQTGTGKTYTMEGLGQSNKLRRAFKVSDNQPNSASSNRKVSDGGGGGLSGLDQSAKMAGRRKLSSIEGDDHDGTSESQDQAGMIPRTFEQIFSHVAKHPEIQFLIRASYLEIYQEEIRDLLKKDKTTKLELHERSDIGVYVKDLTSFVCKSIGEIQRVMRVGNQNRMVGATDMNEHSSRSHAIFMITIEQQQQQSLLSSEQNETMLLNGGSKLKSKSGNDNDDGGGGSKKSVIRVGKLSLVDLAGSERQRKTNSFGQRQKESIKINLSLSALGNVINSLMKLQQQRQQQQQQQQIDNNSKASNSSNALIHTPYRDSKLTRLLQDSLGGNAKTLMIANIGPASYNYDETINTLNYASRARCIKNRPKLNEDPKDALLRQLQQEIDLLRAKLADIKQNQSPPSGDGNVQNGSEQSSGVSSAKSSRDSASLSHDQKSALNQTASITRDDGVDDGGGGGGGSGGGGSRLVEKELLELRQKLTSLESKLLNGDKSMSAASSSSATTSATAAALALKQVVDTNLLKGLTREQELELERRRNELANQVGREQAIRDELERREEAEMLAKQSFSSIQQEVDAKRRLIRQVLLKVKAIRDELYTAQQAYRIELDELDQLQCVLHKELKLKCLIMDNFVPNSHVDQLLSRIIYDDRRNICYIDPIQLPTSDCCIITMGDDTGGDEVSMSDNFYAYWRPTYDSIRPKSEFERISEAIYPNNIRYKYEDLIEPRLEFVNRQPLPVERRVLGDKLLKDSNNLAGRVAGSGASGQLDRDLRVSELQALLNEALNQREPDIVI